MSSRKSSPQSFFKPRRCRWLLYWEGKCYENPAREAEVVWGHPYPYHNRTKRPTSINLSIILLLLLLQKPSKTHVTRNNNNPSPKKKKTSVKGHHHHLELLRESSRAPPWECHKTRFGFGFKISVCNKQASRSALDGAKETRPHRNRTTAQRHEINPPLALLHSPTFSKNNASGPSRE